MKKTLLILVPIILVCSVIGLILFACLRNPTNTPDTPTHNTEYQETTESTEPTQTDPMQDTTQPKEDETTVPNETTDPTDSTTPSTEPDSGDTTEPDISDDTQNTDPSKPDETKPTYTKPEQTVVKIGNSEIQINSESKATDLFEQLNLQYYMVPNTEGLVKINTYRSSEQDGVEYGAINTLEYDIEGKTKFCGVTIMLEEMADESVSILNINKHTTFDELVEMFGEPKKIDGYGLDNMYTQTTTVNGDKLLLIATINPETNCVGSLTVTFW